MSVRRHGGKVSGGLMRKNAGNICVTPATTPPPPRRFYGKVWRLHSELYRGPSDGLANPLLAFTLIKRLHADWLNVVYSRRARDNAQGRRAGIR